MLNRDAILQLITQDPIYETILQKYFSDVEERNEFRQFLWLQICETPNEKIESIWHKGYFLYWYCSVIKNQVISSSSRWHKEHRTSSHKLNNILFDCDDMLESPETTRKNKYLNQAIEFILDTNTEESKIIHKEIGMENKKKVLMISEAIGHHLNRDPKLKTEFDLFNMYHQDGLTYREIQNKTRIPLSGVFRYIKDAEILIKNNINQRINRTR